MNSYKETIISIINYIEENIREDINLNLLAEKAYISKYHFHRIFSAITGDTLMNYIKRRRLTLSIKDLLESEDKIIDIAFKYRFDSHGSYTRAFKNVFGYSPAEFRKKGEYPILQGKSKINIFNLKGGQKMNVNIIEKDEFYVKGITVKTTMKENTKDDVIPKLWCNFVPKMSDIKGRINPEYAYGMCKGVDDPNEENGAFLYTACVEVDKDAPSEDMEIIKIPAHKYAEFTHVGKLSTLKKTYDYIYSTWFPNSKFTCANLDLEIYGCDFKDGQSDNSVMKILIAIK